MTGMSVRTTRPTSHWMKPMNLVLRYASRLETSLIFCGPAVLDESDQRKLLLTTAGADSNELLNTVKDMLCLLCHAQSHEPWLYYALSNGGLYLVPTSAPRYGLRQGNANLPDELDAHSVGLVITAMAYTRLTFDLPGARFAEAYVLLSHFIHQQLNGHTLRGILDEAPA